MDLVEFTSAPAGNDRDDVFGGVEGLEVEGRRREGGRFGHCDSTTGNVGKLAWDEDG